jgi:hypothetical protein
MNTFTRLGLMFALVSASFASACGPSDQSPTDSLPTPPIVGTPLPTPTPAVLPQYAVLTMGNDPAGNELDVAYNGTVTPYLTQGKGGVGGNATGIAKSQDGLVAVVNYATNSVAIYRVLPGFKLGFVQLVHTAVGPVSVAFEQVSRGRGHLIVASVQKVQTFSPVGQKFSEVADSEVTLPNGGAPAQVGYVTYTDREPQVALSLKGNDAMGGGKFWLLDTDGGRLSTNLPHDVPLNMNTNLSPFGYDIKTDGTIVLTIAHSQTNAAISDGGDHVVYQTSAHPSNCWLACANDPKSPFFGNCWSANTGSSNFSYIAMDANNFSTSAANQNVGIAASVPKGDKPVDIAVARAGGQDLIAVRVGNAAGDGSYIQLYTPDTAAQPGTLKELQHIPLGTTAAGANSILILTNADLPTAQ